MATPSSRLFEAIHQHRRVLFKPTGITVSPEFWGELRRELAPLLSFTRDPEPVVGPNWGDAILGTFYGLPMRLDARVETFEIAYAEPPPRNIDVRDYG